MRERLLTAEELGWQLGLQTGTVRAWTRRGKLPVLRLSYNVYRYHWGDVLKFLRKREAEREQAAEEGDAVGRIVTAT